MKPAPVFLTIGYSLGATLGLCAGLLGASSLAGVLILWIGGGALSIGVAFGWYRGFWLQSLAQAPDQTILNAQEPSEFGKWDRDLAAETFATDQASDRVEAAKRTARLNNDDRAAG
jgi:hypothetical protein